MDLRCRGQGAGSRRSILAAEVIERACSGRTVVAEMGLPCHAHGAGLKLGHHRELQEGTFGDGDLIKNIIMELVAGRQG